MKKRKWGKGYVPGYATCSGWIYKSHSCQQTSSYRLVVLCQLPQCLVFAHRFYLSSQQQVLSVPSSLPALFSIVWAIALILPWAFTSIICIFHVVPVNCSNLRFNLHVLPHCTNNFYILGVFRAVSLHRTRIILFFFFFFCFRTKTFSLGLVAQACNLSHSKGWGKQRKVQGHPG